MFRSYIGTKIINACPGLGGEAGQEDGYIVQYPDGYTSWSPKAVFEAAYRPIDRHERELLTRTTDEAAIAMISDGGQEGIEISGATAAEITDNIVVHGEPDNTLQLPPEVDTLYVLPDGTDLAQLGLDPMPANMRVITMSPEDMEALWGEHKPNVPDPNCDHEWQWNNIFRLWFCPKCKTDQEEDPGHCSHDYLWNMELDSWECKHCGHTVFGDDPMGELK